jgi:hypothetical protein
MEGPTRHLAYLIFSPKRHTGNLEVQDILALFAGMLEALLSSLSITSLASAQPPKIISSA